MKLQKFIKNKKVKNSILVSIVALVLIIGGVTFYRTFAFYEEKESFDVLMGVVPDFRDDDFKKLVDIIGSHAKNYDELLTNEEDVDRIVESKEAMELIKDSDELKDKIKTNEAYPKIVEKFLNSTVLSNEEKYNAGLPCYLYNMGTISSMIGSFANQVWHRTDLPYYDANNTFCKNDTNSYNFEVSYAGTYITLYSSKQVNLQNYNHLGMYYSHNTNYANLTGITTLGIASDQNINNFLTSNLEKYNNSDATTFLKVDIQDYDGSYYIKIKVQHNGELLSNTVYNFVQNIIVY